jgi:uncharacterized repeat protein (TIGR02543 family)
MKISTNIKSRKFVALVSSLALLGMVVSAPAHAGDDRSRRLIQLAKPRGLAATPAATSIVATFSTVSNASSYTVRVYPERGERLVGSYNSSSPSVRVTGLSPVTKYKITVRAIGNRTTYTDSDESDEVRVTTTRLATYSITWNSACHDSNFCTPATGGSNTYTEGQAIVSRASDPRETGYTFVGWSSSNTLATTDPSITPVSPYGNITFTALWTPVTYNITWNSACHNPSVCTLASISQSTYTPGQGIDSPYSNPSELGWTWTGWTWDLPFVTVPPRGPRVAAPYGDLTFTGTWTANPTHAVSWDLACPDANPCGSASGGSVNYTEGLDITYPTEAPSVSGWIFDGWSSNSSAITTPSTTPITPYGDITFTAQWRSDAPAIPGTHKITWLCNGPGEVNSCTAGGDTSYTEGPGVFPNQPFPQSTQEGTIFDHWQLIDGNTDTDGSIMAPFVDLVYEGQWFFYGFGM